ncbi:metalloregulator ArsR/SmtB family transcription factor [Aquidulcibacter paucihalophilus]|uniref:metalloregulator ArsR/SmtB family transcription factor n=1 Tax=Aquidulcibacter paucihalophilus TaxID=1978549 RepID=UPI000A19A7AA|nr:metalloregulator ArsR/SmtB family transcription factor [Aquidulcibacter paucihalophilus]
MVTHLGLADNPIFDALGDPTRRAILDLLRPQARSAGEVASHFSICRPGVAKHIRILKDAKLISERSEGRNRIYSLEPEALQSVDRWLQPYRVFWASRLVSLKHLIEAQGAQTHDI